MVIGQPRRHAPARSAVQKTDLDEKRLVDLLQCVLLFGQGGGQGVEAHRPAVVLLNDCAQQATIKLVEAVRVHFQHLHQAWDRGVVESQAKSLKDSSVNKHNMMSMPLPGRGYK